MIQPRLRERLLLRLLDYDRGATVVIERRKNHVQHADHDHPNDRTMVHVLVIGGFAARGITIIVFERSELPFKCGYLIHVLYGAAYLCRFLLNSSSCLSREVVISEVRGAIARWRESANILPQSSSLPPTRSIC